MKKNFTQLIAKSSSLKRYSFAVTTLLLLIASTAYLRAAVGITVTGGSTITVSADLAKNSTGPTAGGQYTSLGTITIAEPSSSTDDFGSSNTIEINAPVGWEFNTEGSFPYGVAVIGREVSNPTKSVTTNLISVTANKITFTYSGASFNKNEEFIISGLKVRAIDGASAPETVAFTISSASSIAGLPATVFTINHTNGVAKKIAFGQQPTSTTTGSAITPSPTVLIQDQFANTVLGNITQVSVSIGNNPAGSNGALNGTKTVAAVNGVAPFPGLSIDAAGSGYTLAATTTSLGGATSSLFNVSSKVPTLNAPTACVTEGDNGTTITLTGANFEKNTVVQVNGNNRTTTFVSATQLQATLLTSDLALAGNISLRVLNPGPPVDNYSNAQSLLIRPVLKATDIVGERIVCAGNDVLYTAPEGYTEYNWTSSAGSSVLVPTSNPAVVRFSPTVPTSGKVTISVSAKNACNVSSSASIEVEVKPTPQAVIERDKDSFCVGGNLELRAFINPANLDSYFYKWFKQNAGGGYDEVGSDQPTYTVTAVGTYRLTVTGANGCANTSDPVAVTVDPLPVVSITGLNTAYCSSDPAVTLVGSPSGGSFKILKGGSELATGTSFNPGTLGAGDYIVEYTYTDGNSCTNTTTQAVTVKQQPTVILTNDLEICLGNSETLNASGADTYTWSPAIGLSATSGASVTANPTQTTTYTVIGTTNGCQSVAKTVTVTVNPLPVVTADNKSVCFGNNAVALTGSPAGGTWSGTGVSGSTFSANGLTASDYAVTYTYTDAKGCTNTAQATVTVNPLPVATITASGPTTFCNGGSVTLTANSGSAYLWSNGSTEQSITVSTSGTFTVKVTDANGCTSLDSDPVTVTVNPIPDIPVVVDGKVCDQGEVTLGATVGTNGTIVRWYTASTGETPVATGASYTTPILTATTTYYASSYNAITGCESARVAVVATVNPLPTVSITPTGPLQFCEGNSVVLVPTALPSGDTFSYAWFNAADNSEVGTTKDYVATTSGDYYLVITNQNGCQQTSQTLTVIVAEKPAEANITITGASTFCQGGSVKLSANTSPDPENPYTYKWFKNDVEILNVTNADFTANESGDYQVEVTNLVEDCSKLSAKVKITVLSQPAASITSGNEQKCIGAGNTTTFTVTGTFSGGTAQWLSSNSNFAISNPVYNSTTGQATATVKATGTGASTIILRTTNSVTNCTTANSSVSLTVNPLPSAAISTTTPTTFCAGGSVVLSAPAGDYSYQWFRNGASIASPEGTDRHYNATLAGNYTVRVTNNATTCSAITSAATTVTVNQQPVVSSASASPAAKCVGEGDVTVFDLTGTVANGDPLWTVVPGSQTGSAAVTNISSPNTLNTDVTVAGVGTVTMRLTANSNVASCNDATRDVTLTVHPYPIANAGPDQALCSGGNSTRFTRQGSGTGSEAGTEIKWTVKSTDPGVTVTDLAYPWVYGSFVDITGVGSATLTMTITTNGCTTSDDVIYTVKPNPTVNAVNSRTVCNNATVAAINFGSSVAGSTYSWTSSRDIGFGTSGDGNIPAFTAVNTGTAPVTATINVRATAADCQGPQQSFTITVNPTPTVSSPATASTCSGATFTYNPASATASTTYIWTRAAAGGNAAANGDGPISEVLTNTTTAPITVTYVITPSANDCAGTPQNVVVTVNPRPILSSPLTATVCSGTTFTYTPTSATPGTLTFRWTREAVPGISNAAVTTAQTGGINETLVNTTTAPINVTYVYTSTASGCTGDPQNLVVTVNPRPVLSSTLTPAAICSGATFSYTPTSETNNASFAWTRLAAAGINNGASATGNGAISETLTNSTANPINVTYRFTTTANNCSGTSTQDVVVRVNPKPTLTSTLTPTAVCSESAFIYTPTSATSGATYTWTRAGVTGISNPEVTAVQSGAINETLINSTTTDKTVVYAYTITANGCSNTQNVSVVVKPKPTPSFTGVTDGQVFYSGDGNVTLTGNYTSGGTFSGAGVTGTTFTPCNALSTGVNTVTVPITYTVNLNGCITSVTKTVTVKRSTYTVVVTAVPFPFCRGDNVTYTAKVYRDVTSIVYPYLVDAQGNPVYENGTSVPSGSGNLPVANDKPVSEGGYPFPAGTPEIIKKMGYRYFEPIVTGGTLVNPNDFTYQWHKNEKVDRKNDGVITTDAGLSSQDYYGVYVKSKDSNNCVPYLNDRVSDRKYSAEMETFSSTLTANPICKEGTINFTATLNSAFPYWSIAGLSMELVRKRGELVIGTAIYNNSNTYTFNVNVPSTDLVNGDEVYIRFNSFIDQYRVNSKCAGRPSSNVVTIQIDQPVTITTNLTATPQEKCVGETASYTVNATGTGLQFEWYKVGSSTPLTIGGNISVTNTTSSSTLTITSVIEANAGEYYAKISNAATSVCSTFAETVNAKLVVNPLPLAKTVLAPPFCPVNATGSEITVENSESGVDYTLKQGTSTLKTMSGNGGTISFGIYPEGTYNVSALNGNGCSNPAAGSVTVTSTTETIVRGELQITWLNDKTQWEIIAFSDHADKSGLLYDWYIGEGDTEPTTTTVNTITIDNEDPDLVVKCIIRTTGGECIRPLQIDNSAITPLPVEIIYLTAQKQGYNVMLEWATAMERDNAGFEIQVSQDGHTYRKLDFVTTKNGNSSQKQVYKYVDKENGKYGTRYYRLKQTDVSGQVEYFGPKVVEFGSVTNKITVYPNPFVNKIEMNIEAEQEGLMEIILTNSIGKQLIQKTVMVEKGLNSEQLILESNLPQGVYFVTTRMGSVTNHFKLLKQ